MTYEYGKLYRVGVEQSAIFVGYEADGSPVFCQLGALHTPTVEVAEVCALQELVA